MNLCTVSMQILQTAPVMSFIDFSSTWEPTRTPYFICSHFISFNLSQSPLILSFMTETLLKSSVQCLEECPIEDA